VSLCLCGLKKMITRTLIGLLLLTLCTPRPAVAWSRKGHVIVTRAAVKLLLDDPKTPPALQALLQEGLGKPEKVTGLEEFVVGPEVKERLDAGLDLYSFRPDELVGAHSTVSAFGIGEDKMHYLDMEMFHPDPKRRRFSPDGANKVRAGDLPRRSSDPRYREAGFLTFRAEQSYRNLVQSLRNNYTNEQVFLWLGYLSHYISDSYQPYHSSIDYRGFDCPCNEGREKKHDFHPDLEGTLFRDDRPAGRQLRAVYWGYFREALAAGAGKHRAKSPLDPYLVTQEALLTGYDYLPMLCRAGTAALARGEFDPDAWFNYRERLGKREISVLELKAERMALATLALRALILQAWYEAHGKLKG
jgi:hypothetical protein